MANAPISTHQYDIGDSVRTTATWMVAGVLTDPTAVTFKYKSPSGVITTLTYGVDSGVVRDSTGTYHADFIATASGSWHYRWAGTGTAYGAAERRIQVNTTEF